MSSKFNITVDSPSPIISYSTGDWSPVTSGDPEFAQYNGSTAMKSLGAGKPAAGLSFNGTGIWVVGARRSNHGLYTASVDGNSLTANGYANPDEQQQLLFGVSDLPQKAHTFTVVNKGNSDGSNAYFDIDYITLEAEVLNNTTTVVFDDTAPEFSFLPNRTSWSAQEDGSTSFNASLTSTTVSGAQARLNFTGEYVAVYGTLGLSHGKFTCAVDGGTTNLYVGTYSTTLTQQMLCLAGPLGTGSHSIVLSNAPVSNTSAALSIDFAKVWGVTQPTNAAHAKKTNAAAIAIGTLAGVAFVMLLLVLFLLRRRRKLAKPRKRVHDVDLVSDSPVDDERDKPRPSLRQSFSNYITPFLVPGAPTHSPSHPDAFPAFPGHSDDISRASTPSRGLLSTVGTRDTVESFASDARLVPDRSLSMHTSSTNTVIRELYSRTPDAHAQSPPMRGNRVRLPLRVTVPSPPSPETPPDDQHPLPLSNTAALPSTYVSSQQPPQPHSQPSSSSQPQYYYASSSQTDLPSSEGWAETTSLPSSRSSQGRSRPPGYGSGSYEPPTSIFTNRSTPTLEFADAIAPPCGYPCSCSSDFALAAFALFASSLRSFPFLI